ncbi:prephenate dehydratase [Phosphitispora fastidiosa]|uniref:prephenate dehydratase n=1 Tax=Phosphitispora fastidiosa TaxID=2837202 RepID=UPI001E374774|nr:prephenate dehydratase [Phosphitispora fastidiosa]MBU7007593.1 prephenate dehydratase [Phosphitispora fastidiosa]
MAEKYGYLGPEGTYCEEALSAYLGVSKEKAVPYSGIDRVIFALLAGEITYGLVPLENSTEGTVNITLDLMMTAPELKITGEIIMPIRHNLLARPGTKKEAITAVISHSQALAQCRNYLTEYLPQASVYEVGSTAEAARVAAGHGDCVAAIGNGAASARYGLEIIDRDIHDCKENCTRFAMLSRQENPNPPSAAKISLVVSITDRPGGLYQVLKEFALNNINLTRIESRPAKSRLGDYLFFIDLAGHLEDPVIVDCLQAVKDMSSSFRILGCYPVWESSGSGGKRSAERPLPSVDELRQNIDIIDYQIVDLLAQRTQMVSLIGGLKQGIKAVRDKKREQEVLERVRQNAHRKGVDPNLMERVYNILFEHFVDLQVKQQTCL